MKKNAAFWLTSIGLAVILSGCGTVRQSVEKTPVATKAEETDLSPEKQNEYEYLFIEGLKQSKLNNPKAAVALFSKCLEIDPNSAVAMYELANMHVANGDLTSASLLLEKAIGINPENKWYKLLLGSIYQKTKQFDKAASLFSQLYSANPDGMENLEYLYMNAGMLSSAEKYDEAIAALDLLEKKLGFNEQIVMTRQQIYSAAGQKEKAVGEINKLIEFNPQDTRYYGLMADLYMDQGDSIKALEYYQKILDIEPENGFVHFSLAGYYQKIGDKEKAYEHIREGFKNKELDLQTKMQMYEMLSADPLQAGVTEKQLMELLGFLRALYPDEIAVKLKYIEVQLQKNEFEEARSGLRAIIKQDANNYPVWERILLLDNELQDITSLYDESRQAIEYFPDQPMLYIMNAVACLQQEKYQEVLDILEEGEIHLPDNHPLKVQFELYKADAYYKLDQVKEAFKAFDEVLRLDPENDMALNNYAYYLSERGENLEKAARMSGKTVQANPQNSTYLDTYAWILFMQKDYKMAKFYIESALQNGADESAVILDHAGDILFMSGDKEKALEYWKKALETEGADDLDLLKEKIRQEKYIEKGNK